MILPDVNVLIYAHRGEVRDHARYTGMAGGNGVLRFGIRAQ